MAATETASSRQVWFLNRLINSKLKMKAADWLPQIESENGKAFFEASAEWLAEQGAGKGEVSKAIDFLNNKNRKSGFDGVWDILGLKGHTKAPAKPAAKAEKIGSSDPKTMITAAFLAGEISIEDFTTAIKALESSATVKTVESVEVEPIDLDAEGSTDLPF